MDQCNSHLAEALLVHINVELAVPRPMMSEEIDTGQSMSG